MEQARKYHIERYEKMMIVNQSLDFSFFIYYITVKASIKYPDIAPRVGNCNLDDRLAVFNVINRLKIMGRMDGLAYQN